MLGAALVVALAAPTAYAVSTVRSAHTGALPTAGPASAGRGFGPGGGPQGAGGFPPGATGGARAPGFGPPGFAGPNAGGTTGGPGGFPGGAPGGLPGGTGRGGPGGPGGGLGGLLGGTTVSTQLTNLLERGSDGYRWTAAAVGANNAASYQLASGRAIMAIGGFNGSDPAPTLAQFQSYVRNHRIHYFLGGGSGGGGGFGGPGASSGTSSAISTWVSSHFTATTVGGATVYDLSSPTT